MANMIPPTQRKWTLHLLIVLISLLCSTASAQETFTNSACISATASMNECAKRWDSIRLECKNAFPTNTIWPGPCECAYYRNDLPCFDEQALCAAQVWTQVPQWFRDGVSSCIMKDASYTIRANLGNAQGVMGNPFTVKDLPGKATRTTDAGIVTSTPAQTGAGASMPSATGIGEVNEGLSTGAKAGFGVGIGLGVVLVAVMAFFIARTRRKPPVKDVDIEEKKLGSLSELQDEDSRIHQMEARTAHPKSEMPEVTSPKFELGVRASTWLVELPVQDSNRNSQHR